MIKITTIMPPVPSVKSFQQDLNRIVEATETDMLRGFRRTTKTWAIKAQFDASRSNNQGTITIDVGTDDLLYGQINDGTTAIYDVLSKNFEPKTRPGVLDSFPGRGGRVGKSASPLPGIIPRRWDDAMVDFIEPRMIKALEDLIDDIVAKL